MHLGLSDAVPVFTVPDDSRFKRLRKSAIQSISQPIHRSVRQYTTVREEILKYEYSGYDKGE